MSPLEQPSLSTPGSQSLPFKVPGATYAVVQDVPASWDAYLERVEAIGAPLPEGLLVHVAGPTDEGFRMIEVWESQAAWERFRDERLARALDHSLRLRQTHTTIRDLMVQRLFLA